MLLTLNLEQLEVQNGRHPVSVWAERCGGQGSKGAEKAPSFKSPGGNRRLNTFFKKGDSFRTWKEGEKKSINSLQADIKIRLASLHRAENLQKQRRKKEQTRTWFYKDPFKLLKTLFTKEKSRVLKTTKNNLEEHLRRTDSDPNCWKPLTITSDISPIHPTQNITLMTIQLGKRWRRESIGQQQHQLLGHMESHSRCIRTYQILVVSPEPHNKSTAEDDRCGSDPKGEGSNNHQPVSHHLSASFGVIAERIAECLQRKAYAATSIEKILAYLVPAIIHSSLSTGIIPSAFKTTAVTPKNLIQI